MHRARSFLVVIALNFLTFEVLCFLVYQINPFHVFSEIYYSAIFARQKLPTVPYGWDAYSGIRDTPSREPEDCGAAFGDSFTWGEEVSDAEAWPYIVSRQLGCNVVNYGVGGFGSDQAYIKFETISPKPKLVIFGVYQEMLRRNFAASWAFYAGRSESTIKPMFVIRDGALWRPPLPETNSITDIRNYHEHDRYYFPFKIGFPYFLSLLKVLYYDLDMAAFDRRMLTNDFFTDIDSVRLETILLDKTESSAAGKGQKLAVLFFPSPDQAQAGIYPYKEFMDRYSARHPEVCVIDPGPALTKAHHAMKAPNGHFNTFGNAVIGETVAAALRTCGLE
jgi:hypothetical protein